MKLLTTLLSLVILMLTCKIVKPECCRNSNWEFCDTWCCGCGGCNIFCCNCNNGCSLEWWHVKSYVKQEDGYEPDLVQKQGGHKTDGEYDHIKVCDHWRRKRMTSTANRNISEEAMNMFKEIDLDQSMTISLQEANDFLEIQKPSKRSITFFSLEQEIRKMDTNHDDLISPKEFDNSLAF